MAPKLTIILTSRDRYELLRYAVASVFEQTYRDWELIVADDASTDARVLDYLERLGNGSDRITIFNGQPVSENYRKLHKMNAMRTNAAIHMARGQYISYLGDDNVYLPDRCARMVASLDSGGADMVVDRVRWMLFDGREADQDDYRYGYKEPHEAGHNRLLKAIAPSTYICTDSVMHRKPRPCCMDWPTDVQGHTPVDWRYWCYLVDELGYKVRKLDAVGERAYFPGTWRSGVTIEQVLPARRDLPLRNRRSDMSKMNVRRRRRKEGRRTRREKAKDPQDRVWCVNTSGKRQQIPQNNGRPIIVEPDGRVLEDHVAVTDANGKVVGIFPGFSYDSRVETPPLKTTLATAPKSPKVEYDVDSQGIDAGLQTKPEQKPVEPEPRHMSTPPPDRRKRTVASRKPVEKRPMATPPDEADVKSRLCSSCRKPIYAGNKSGLCRACYAAFRKKKE